MIRRLLGGRGSNLVAAGILLSRIAGLIREALITTVLGLGPVNDAFRFAMRVPNILQNLLGEGALSASFIPVYARLVEEGEQERADRLAITVASLLAAVTAVIVAIGVLAAGPIVSFFTNWEDVPEQYDLTVTLTRITTVGLGFLVLSAWCLGVLNSHRRFFLSYVAPVVWNGVQIAVLGAAVIGSWAIDDLVVILAWAVVVGGFAQFAIQVPTVARLVPSGFRPSFRRTPPVDDVLRRFAPAVGSRGVVQLSSFIDTFLATGLLTFGAFSAYAAALPLYLLPISVFGFSVAAAELTEMSRRSVDVDAVAARVVPALRRVGVPAGFVTIVYLVAGRVVVDGLYGTLSRLLDRNFGANDVTAVGLIITAFAVGLPAVMTARVTQNTLYSLGDVRGPAKIAAVRLAVSTLVSLAVMVQLDWVFVADTDSFSTVGDAPHWPPWELVPEEIRDDRARGLPHLGAVGLAIGASVAAWSEWWLLRRLLARRVGRRITSGWLRRIAVAALTAGGVMALLRLLPIPSPFDAAIVVGFGGVAYVSTLWMQGVRSLSELASKP